MPERKISRESALSEIAAPFFEPYHLKSLRLRNRIAMAPMTRWYSPGGTPGEDVLEYYRRRATGGVGLVITEAIGVDDDMSVDNDRIPLLCGPQRVAAWRRVTDAVHAEGAAIMCQLWHQGPMRGSENPDREVSLGYRPSGLWGTPGLYSCKEEFVAKSSVSTVPMTDEQIADVIANFGNAARDAISAGFDGIEIHGAHGYLVDTFLWADTNRRTDRWGGDARARATFAAEVVRSIRRAIGEERPIIFRFSHHKQQDYNARLADTPAELGAMLEPIADAGADMFHASSRRFNMPGFPDTPDVTLSGWAKRLTGKPSMTVGGIGLNNWLQDTLKRRGDTLAVNNLPEVRELFDKGMFDMFSVGRALISDPEWVMKARAGDEFAPYDRRALRTLV